MEKLTKAQDEKIQASAANAAAQLAFGSNARWNRWGAKKDAAKPDAGAAGTADPAAAAAAAPGAGTAPAAAAGAAAAAGSAAAPAATKADGGTGDALPHMLRQIANRVAQGMRRLWLCITSYIHKSPRTSLYCVSLTLERLHTYCCNSLPLQSLRSSSVKLVYNGQVWHHSWACELQP